MFIARNDGRIGYALENCTRYTILADWALDTGGVFRRCWIACYRGSPIPGARITPSLTNAKDVLVAYYTYREILYAYDMEVG